MKHAKFVSFTEIGAQTAAKAARLLPDFLCERYARTVDLSLSNTSLPRFAQQAMVDCDLIVFVGAAGIAVRAAAAVSGVGAVPANRRTNRLSTSVVVRCAKRKRR